MIYNLEDFIKPWNSLFLDYAGTFYRVKTVSMWVF